MNIRPFPWLVLCFCIGIIMGRSFPAYFSFVFLFNLLVLSAALFVVKRSRLFFVFVLTIFFCSGYLYAYSYGYLHEKDIARAARFYRGKPIAVRGVIVSDIQKKEVFNKNKTSFTLEVRSIQAPWGWEHRNGRILVEIFRPLDIAYGDYLLLEGKLHRPFDFSKEEHLSYSDYLANQQIYYILSVKKDGPIEILGRDQGNFLKARSLKLRDYLRAILTRYLSKNETGLMQAILLGDRSYIAPPLRDLFIHTGTAHILAISGLNVTIVAGLFLLILKLIPLGRRLQILITIILLIAYCFLTGASPSVVRATIMAVVFLGSFILEKPTDTFHSLCLSALIILLMNPLNLWDVGFQLSFVCVWAIIFIYPLLIKMAEKIRIKKEEGMSAPLTVEGLPWASEFWEDSFKSLGLSIGVWITVAGLIAYYFNIITPVTALVNLLIIPCNSIIVVLGFGLLFMGMVFPLWAGMAALSLKLALNIMVGIIFLCDKIPYAYFYVKALSVWFVISYYIIFFIIVFFPWQNILKKINLKRLKR